MQGGGKKEKLGHFPPQILRKRQKKLVLAKIFYIAFLSCNSQIYGLTIGHKKFCNYLLPRRITMDTNTLQKVVKGYFQEKPKQSAHALIATISDSLSSEQSTKGRVSLLGSGYKIKSKEAKRHLVWGQLAQITKEIELFKRSVRQTAKYTDLVILLTQQPQDPNSWDILKTSIQAFRGELQERFSLATSLEKKKGLKSVIDACHLALATISLSKEDPFQMILTEEQFLPYAEENRIILYESERLKKPLAEHLMNIKEMAQSYQFELGVTSSVERITELQKALNEHFNISDPTGWKSSWYNQYSNDASFLLNLEHKQVKAPKSEHRHLKDLITAGRLQPFNEGLVAGFLGNTFTTNREILLTKGEYVLDATYFTASERALTLAGGDGYEHPSSIVRRERISRVAYFGNKHLVRLANTYSKVKELYNDLDILFREAAREARIKSGSDERASATLIKVFLKKGAKKVSVVVGSVGDALAFAYDPASKRFISLANPREYADGLGGFSPVSFMDQDLRPDQIDRVITDIPTGSFVFFMTDGIWEDLDPSEEVKGEYKLKRVEKKAKTLIQRVKTDSVTALDYREIFSHHCIVRAEEKRQNFLKEFSESKEPRGIEFGDDVTMVVFQIVKQRKG